MASKRGTSYIDIKNRLLDMISDMAPQTKLDSRTTLATRFGANKSTVDRAVSELIGEGFLYSVDKSGTYVAKMQARKSVHLGSQPNAWAVVIPNIVSDTYPGIFRGIEHIANKLGKYVMLCNTDNNEKKQERYITNLLDGLVEGIIIIPAITQETNLSFFWKLKQAGIPFVFCNRDVYSLSAPCVKSNDFYGGYIATKYLVQCGCRNVAFLSPPTYSTSSDRYQGYLAALTEYNLPIRFEYLAKENPLGGKRGSYEITCDLIKEHPEIDGLFCFNDNLALGASNAIGDLHRKVGKDIKLIGYDNSSICEELPVKLTSVEFCKEQIGRCAAELLNDLICGKEQCPDKKIILQPILAIRESCCTGI